MNYWNKVKKFLDQKIKEFYSIANKIFNGIKTIWSDPLERYLFLFLIAFVFSVLLFFILWIKQNKVDFVLKGRIAEIRDGDTFILNDKVIHLYGADAPELAQKCEYYNIYTKKYSLYDCGEGSKRYLKKLTKGKKIVCDIKNQNKQGEFFAICYTTKYEKRSKKFLKDFDINGNIIYNGYAIANIKDSRRYANEENKAKNRRNGIWKGSFIKPKKYLNQKNNI